MCLQDLRIGRRLSVRRFEIVGDGSGSVVPIDLTRVSMVVVDPAAGETRLVSDPLVGVASDVVASKEAGNPSSSYTVYTRESMGGAVNAPAWVYTEINGASFIIVHEYDAETMHEIYSPTIKG